MLRASRRRDRAVQLLAARQTPVASSAFPRLSRTRPRMPWTCDDVAEGSSPISEEFVKKYEGQGLWAAAVCGPKMLRAISSGSKELPQ